VRPHPHPHQHRVSQSDIFPLNVYLHELLQTQNCKRAKLVSTQLELTFYFYSLLFRQHVPYNYDLLLTNCSYHNAQRQAFSPRIYVLPFSSLHPFPNLLRLHLTASNHPAKLVPKPTPKAILAPKILFPYIANAPRSTLRAKSTRPRPGILLSIRQRLWRNSGQMLGIGLSV
jgi:hypothetical protein